MRFNACSFLVVFWMCCASSANLVAQAVVSPSEYRFQHYDIRDGLASDDVMSLAQDSLGFVWVQSSGGLSRFDGYNFKVYKNNADNPEKSIDNNGFCILRIDPSRNLWRTPGRQHPNYELAKYDRKTDGFIKYNIQLPESGYVRRVCFERNGATLWFPCRLGLYNFSPETNEVRKFVNFKGDSLASLDRNDMADVVDRDSVLLIASGKGLWIFDKAKKTFLRPATNPKDSAFLNNSYFAYFYERRRNDGLVELWILYNDGLAQIDESFSVVHRFDLPPEMSGRYAISVNGVA